MGILLISIIKMNELVVKQTADGTSTIYNAELDENYHSVHGALQESVHVFIKNGLNKLFNENKNKNQFNILEVGFGTGLNCYLSLQEGKINSKFLNYVGVESMPLKFEIINQLDYNLTKNQKLDFNNLHYSNWNEATNISPNFTLTKEKIEFQKFETKQKFDLIYFDAFGPRVEKVLWHIDIYRKLFMLLKKNSILVTYCAKGQVRRDLISVGFSVDRLPGPPGKREMIRAKKH